MAQQQQQQGQGMMALIMVVGVLVVAALILAEAGIWLSKTIFHTGTMSVLVFARTFFHWRPTHIYGTTILIAHPLLWVWSMRIAMVVLLVAVAALAYAAAHGVKKTGKFFSGSQATMAGGHSDDPAKWMPFPQKKFKSYTPAAVIARNEVRPSQKKTPIVDRRLEEYGFIAGYANGNPEHPIAFSSELSVLVTGPPRSGKTAGLVVPWAASWRGPLVTTSTKNEVLRMTFLARKQVSDRVYVLSVPNVEVTEGVEPISYDICWFYEAEWSSLVHSAGRRAEVFASVAEDKNQRVWGQAARSVFACLLLIGFAWRCALIETSGGTAGDGAKTLNDIEKNMGLSPKMHHVTALKRFATLTWMKSPETVQKVQEFLRQFIPGGKGDYVAEFVGDTAIGYSEEVGTTEFAKTVTGIISVGLGTLNDPQIAAMFSTPWDKPIFDPEQFLAESGTLYLISRDGDSGSLAEYFSLVVNEISAAARRRAAKGGGRCDPGLALILDEVANIAPLPDLRSYMSEGGGNGITTVAILQSLRQLHTVYGDTKATDIKASANVSITFGGGKNLEDLQTSAQLSGTRVIQVGSYDAAGKLTGRSDQIQPMLTPEQIANLPAGWMQVQVPYSPVAIVQSIPWWDIPKYGKGNPARVHKWLREWGGALSGADEGYPFHGVKRALSYRAIYDLVNKSQLVPLVRLEREWSELRVVGVSDTDGTNSASGETTDQTAAKDSQEPAKAGDTNDGSWGSEKTPTHRRKMKPKAKPSEDGLGSLFDEAARVKREAEERAQGADGKTRGLFDNNDGGETTEGS